MERDLIVQVLKSACGNKKLRFQVIVQNSKLHIYVNRQLDYHPDYSLLTDTITNAIACLGWDDLQGIWIYCRQLGEIEPDWQVFVESPATLNQSEMDTAGTTVAEAETNFSEVEDSPEVNGLADRGLLENAGLIQNKPLQEVKNTTLVLETTDNEPNTAQAESENELKPLQEYCFVSNKKILTGDILTPDKQIIRLVKFFHHLSDNNQQKILPFLTDFFKIPTIPEIENLAVAVKKWLKQIAELNEEDRQIVAIWLSRYCFNSEATLAEFKQIEAKKATRAKSAQKIKRTNTEYSFTPANPVVSSTPLYNEQVDDFDLVKTQKKWQIPPVVTKIGSKILIPGAWICATIIFLILGIYTNHLQTPQTSEAIPAICQTSIGSSNYCRLGVNLVGEKTIQESSASIFPLSEITESVAKYGCERFANVKAEAFNNLDPKHNPVISSYGEKIFPHIYVVNVLQKHHSQEGEVRVACVYTTGEGERSPKRLASELIPLNWTKEHYQAATISEVNLSFGRFGNLVNLGLYTLFAALGLGIASNFNLGLKITNRPQTIYVVSVILGMVQLVAVSLPIFNLIASIVLPVLAIFMVSLLSKNFQLSYNHGYSLIISGILMTIAIQLLCYGIVLKLIYIFYSTN